MSSLTDKVIIVTGGTGILGAAFVDAIAGAGGIVGILGRNEAVAEERAGAIRQKGGKAIALIADVLEETQLEAARDKILSEYGRIDGLVNGAGGNMAGAVVQPGSDIFSMDMNAMSKVLELNLMGTLKPTQVFGKAMLDSAGGGSIVNISSVSAKNAISRVLGYSMAKTAVESYTKWFAVEAAFRHGDAVRMNAIVPGFFLTEQNRNLLTQPDGSLTERGQKVVNHTPYKRFGQPEELNGALLWLLGDESRFVTGTTITVDGGFTVFGGV